MEQAKAMFAHRLHRTWGHSFVRGFARVLLSRLRDNVGTTHTATRRDEVREADADYNYHNPPDRGFLN